MSPNGEQSGNQGESETQLQEAQEIEQSGNNHKQSHPDPIEENAEQEEGILNQNGELIGEKENNIPNEDFIIDQNELNGPEENAFNNDMSAQNEENQNKDPPTEKKFDNDPEKNP